MPTWLGHPRPPQLMNGQATAHTTYGTIGVKGWIFKGEVLRPTNTAEA